MFNGLWYASDCCHHCAMAAAAHSEGLSIEKMADAVDEGAELIFGYLNEKGEFVADSNHD